MDIGLHCEFTVGTGGRIFRFAEVESGGHGARCSSRRTRLPRGAFSVPSLASVSPTTKPTICPASGQAPLYWIGMDTSMSLDSVVSICCGTHVQGACVWCKERAAS